jgi:hypothetical protein
MRIEERNNDWVRTWAFKISENKAMNEGYESVKGSGSMQKTPEYPGCPYCGSFSIAQCSCGKLFCWSSRSNAVSCPWCGQVGEYQAVKTIEFEGNKI